MKITEHLAKAEKPLFSFEVLPPLRGQSIQGLFEHMDPLMEFNPPFVDVTYHREEYIFKKRPDGYHERVSIRKRPGTVGICAAINHRYDVDTVPHIICGGFTKSETENALIDLDYLGICNVLLLRGDPISTERSFKPEENGHHYALDLVEQVNSMNQGKYLHEEVQNATATNFCIGVAGYPEKHEEAPNLDADIRRLKAKVDAGADYIVTQMFFDNSKFFAFVDRCREAGINVPIIPGLKPMTTKSQLSILPKIFHIDLPCALSEAVENAKDNAAVRQVGIEWSIQQSKELIKQGVPCLHYYSMGKSQSVYNIAKALF